MSEKSRKAEKARTGSTADKARTGKTAIKLTKRMDSCLRRNDKRTPDESGNYECEDKDDESGDYGLFF